MNGGYAYADDDGGDWENTFHSPGIPPPQPLFYFSIASQPAAPDKIDDNLFLGGLAAAVNKPKLQDLGVTDILTVADGLGPPRFPDVFKYTVVEVDDAVSENLAAHFDHCFSAIDDARSHGRGILVHCLAGMSRSVTVVVAYLMKTKGMSFREALFYVKQRRAIAQPNSGFVRQLEQFEASLQMQKQQQQQEEGEKVQERTLQASENV
eukprot:TRINITY_DN7117_c0_g1_i1.p1 TRINITY_DN7117_c0_g1~~TRINITY_DN7117_c0_g1_i1.p1  ORF type:complete len:208 (+),score=61.68 TRINITY_DN7117_c0_g1_i1:235-858(+)